MKKEPLDLLAERVVPQERYAQFGRFVVEVGHPKGFFGTEEDVLVLRFLPCDQEREEYRLSDVRVSLSIKEAEILGETLREAVSKARETNHDDKH